MILSCSSCVYLSFLTEPFSIEVYFSGFVSTHRSTESRSQRTFLKPAKGKVNSLFVSITNVCIRSFQALFTVEWKDLCNRPDALHIAFGAPSSLIRHWALEASKVRRSWWWWCQEQEMDVAAPILPPRIRFISSPSSRIPQWQSTTGNYVAFQYPYTGSSEQANLWV